MVFIFVSNRLSLEIKPAIEWSRYEQLRLYMHVQRKTQLSMNNVYHCVSED